jgi:outer membrane immunogenic protein
MKKLQLACIGACVLSTVSSAFGADVGVARKRVIAAAPIATWTGFYVGVDAGYGWGRSDVNPAGANVFCNPLLGGCPGAFTPGQVLAWDVISAQAVPAALGPHSRGGLLGGTVGYNVQFGSWVAGVETDLAWTNIVGSAAQATGPIVVNPGIPLGPATVAVAAFATVNNRLGDFGTLRGRLGFTPVAPLLIYGTGGFAYGRVTSDLVVGEAFTGPCGVPIGCPVTPAIASSSSTRTGWTVGGGAEYMFAGQWSVKAEYLYYDLGSKGYGVTGLNSLGNCAVAPAAAPCPFTSVNVTATSSDFRGSIVRLGLNYKFGGVAAPVYK